MTQRRRLCFVQFGHNDEVPTKKTYTTETEFKNNLKQYVAEARSKKAIPILLHQWQEEI
jgi:lysophospholipase L1-like esterase